MDKNSIISSQQSVFGVMNFGYFINGLAFATQVSSRNKSSVGCCILLIEHVTGRLVLFMHTSLFCQNLSCGQPFFKASNDGFSAFASPLVATAMVTRGIPVRLHRVISSQDDCSCIFHFHFFYVTNVAIHIPVLASPSDGWMHFQVIQERLTSRQLLFATHSKTALCGHLHSS